MFSEFGTLLHIQILDSINVYLRHLFLTISKCLHSDKNVTCLTDCFSPSCLAGLDNDFPAAKALYEQMQKEGAVIDELSLKRVARLYRKAGEELPFTEPPVSLSHTHTHTYPY